MSEQTDHSIPDHEGEPVDLSTAHAGRRATVLQVLPSMGLQGGVERGTVDMAAAIVAAGGRAIVAAEEGLLAPELKRHGAEFVPLPLASKNPLVMHKNVNRLVELIETEQVDLVHARSRAPAWSAYRACKRTGTPFVTTFHGTYGHGNFFKRWYNSVMTRGQPIIAISKFIAAHMHRIYGIPMQKVRIIHRGIDTKHFDPDNVSAERVIQLASKWRMTDGAPVIALPGRLTRWKGQMFLVDAIAELGRTDICCLLIGSDQGRAGYREELEAHIVNRGVASVVQIIDDCRDMPAAYKLSDVVVSASIEPEAFGRIAAEAQSMGRPVVATNHGGARETVVEGVTGWLAPPDDAAALARCLERALALTPEDRQTMAKRARAHVIQHFSKESMTSATLEVYDEVLHPERHPTS
ncbi:glycosyltransferase family 4 protein [Magnetospira sp. QH-2]|uniref:glycosyltransferase family 4 protein n=1 Tax=Magnetospira sp. (strain QH-2) TaxID=1288970 RepID=UPI0003E81196|nr:glycosyltransferase family 4 protein [Magnetospira sp. QH-2]CCQ72074.1 putative GT4 : distantly related to UDP-GlcNAc: LPS a-N-acetylglucosaminyltransferase [Magnetospira sp. QH-2]